MSATAFSLKGTENFSEFHCNSSLFVWWCVCAVHVRVSVFVCWDNKIKSSHRNLGSAALCVSTILTAYAASYYYSRAQYSMVFMPFILFSQNRLLIFVNIVVHCIWFGARLFISSAYKNVCNNCWNGRNKTKENERVPAKTDTEWNETVNLLRMELSLGLGLGLYACVPACA